MILEMKKSMDIMTDQMKENKNYKRRDESETSDGSVMKLKGKWEETYILGEHNAGNVDQSKYKKLECRFSPGKIPSPGYLELSISSKLIPYQKQKK